MYARARTLAATAVVAALTLGSVSAAGAVAMPSDAVADLESRRDYHSFANTAQMQVRHLDLSLDVDFDAHRLSGVVDLEVERRDDTAATLVLDTRDLVVRQTWLVSQDGRLESTAFELGAPVGTLGEPLVVRVPTGAIGSRYRVRISYQTRPQASGLQWLEPAQTAGRSHPFLYSQSQAIHARSWIPLQDTPQLRVTYSARVHAPPGLRAVMSAENPPGPTEGGWFSFRMPQPVPSYLIALAVGRLEYRALGPRTGIYAEPLLIERAAREFADTEAMLEACERLFGPYRWERYDMLVLPLAFPYGGMENPRLTFLTPTLLAGDRSLVSLIAHELAHSWSGNLVTNATWRDFWLNEGFTVFLERRILEALYGEKRREMEDVLGLQSLRRDLAVLAPRDQMLAVDLRGRDPDDAFSDVPYEKGRLFLGWLEARVGREPLERFLREYFDAFAFRSVTTEEFRAHLERELLASRPGTVRAAELDAWLYSPGLPDFAVLPRSEAFASVDAARTGWLDGQIALAALPARAWSTFEWLHFLDNLPSVVPPERLAELDTAFGLTATGNAEIAHSWLRVAIRNSYAPAWPRLEEFLLTIGRRKLIRPLYEDLMRTADGARFAREVYARARSGYHPIAVATLDPIVRGAPAPQR
jgi:aminopeptidase N